MKPMDFRMADTFTESLGRLTAQKQKAVKTTAFDLRTDPSGPGLSSVEAEIHAVGTWLSERLKESHQPEEIAVFVRSDQQLSRAQAGVELAGGAAATLRHGTGVGVPR
jgi:hypothetical protein